MNEANDGSKWQGNSKMKCDKLEAKDVYWLNRYINENFAAKDVEDFYPKSQVDEAITEMKDENRQLKRTVWIVRAENAFSMACYNGTLAHGWRYFRGDLQKAKEYEELKQKWNKIERLCRDKADSYLCKKE